MARRCWLRDNFPWVSCVSSHLMNRKARHCGLPLWTALSVAVVQWTVLQQEKMSPLWSGGQISLLSSIIEIMSHYREQRLSRFACHPLKKIGFPEPRIPLLSCTHYMSFIPDPRHGTQWEPEQGNDGSLATGVITSSKMSFVSDPGG